MKQDVCVVGHVSIDYDEAFDGKVRKFVGGALFYSSYAEISSGRRVMGITKLAEEDSHILDPFYMQELVRLPSRATTSIHNVYHTPDRERRTSTVRAVADPFTPDDIPESARAEIFQMAGLIHGDCDNSLFAHLAARGKIACDMQGFVRRVQDGKMFYQDWEEKQRYLPHVTYLKLDAAEAEVITGTGDRRRAAEILHGWGAGEILITHHTEVLVFDGKRHYTCPIRSRNLSGRTGRGDTTFGSYITERIDQPPERALLYATALVSLKMETFGPFRGRRSDVARYVRELYPEYEPPCVELPGDETQLNGGI